MRSFKKRFQIINPKAYEEGGDERYYSTFYHSLANFLFTIAAYQITNLTTLVQYKTNNTYKQQKVSFVAIYAKI
jgi:hypothetical protein